MARVPPDENAPAPLAPGLYDHLLSESLEHRLSIHACGLAKICQKVDAEEAHAALAQYLEHLLAGSLAGLRGTEAVERQRRLANRIIDMLQEELGNDAVARLQLADPLQRLLAIHRVSEVATASHPETPLGRSALLTGTRLDPSLASQLKQEIATADRVDILCSFIKWSGLRLLLGALRELTAEPHANGPRLRVISTSYMGATDPKAMEALLELPHTQLKVSYDTQRTRLHAKAYLVRRDAGFGSAYVGSANISRAAMSEGLEWTTKVSQYELPHLWQKVEATFDTYWNHPEFEAYDEGAKVRFRRAIAQESRPNRPGDAALPVFDLRPYPFQEEILDALAVEREIQNKHRHLVVAATGTGKTMVAAFDYARWSRAVGGRPSLLFVAHREEILRQALGTYRGVLRDQNFGDLLVGQTEPQQQNHLFCSIQSYNSRALYQLDAHRYDYVVVDEFHHAAADSYRRLLDHVQPQVLLGLTATPERTDGLDILGWFEGHASAEIRLPDAINRRLLCPFQYFGVSDCVDLDSVSWQRGGYRTDELDRCYTGNDARAHLVLAKVHELLLETRRARGLGFCVSVAHAEYMAAFFNRHGLPALALSADSPPAARQAARQRLVNRSVNFIFVVDLYNEGVDIPEVDTVLFLRPTESLTVYLQQLGRGLRPHQEKECLTVLDFIGAQRREFRFGQRFRALSLNPTGKLDREVEAGFPHLPPGCFIQLERVAQQRILENIRQSLQLRRDRLVSDLRQLIRDLGRRPSIQEALDYLGITLDDLLKRGLWSRLVQEASDSGQIDAPDEDQLAKGIRRLSHIDDPEQIRFLQNWLGRSHHQDTLPEVHLRRLNMLHLSLWGKRSTKWTLAEAEARFRQNSTALDDLRAVLEYRLANIHTRTVTPTVAGVAPLAIHAAYTRDEILAGLGFWTLEHQPSFREGVLHLRQDKLDVFFITLHKTEAAYSPTTMYEDYAISDQLFHWQSQSTTSAESPTGQRYIRHRELGYTPLLFVREYRTLPGALSTPYAFVGPAQYVSHEGSRPMSIVWRLDIPMPTRLCTRAQRLLSV